MSQLDEQMRRRLRNLAAQIAPDARDLSVVRHRHGVARRRARRVAALGVLALAGLSVVVVVTIGHSGWLGGLNPVGPGPSSTTPTNGPYHELTNPFSIVRTIAGADVGIDRPLKVAVSPNGHVYISDLSQHITELTGTGGFVRRWGGHGTRPGKFRLYSGALTVSGDGRVYVADTGNFRIQVFTSTGRFLGQYGGYGSGAGKFVWPSDIVVGKDGTMYVADDRAATVTALSPDGRQLWRRGTPTEVDTDLVGHEHLGGVDAAGRLVTANDDAGKILFLGLDGRVVDDFSTDQAGAGVDPGGLPGGHFPNGACGATIDAHGDVFVSSCEESYAAHHDTAVYSPQHQLVAGWRRGILVDSPVFGPDGHGWAVTSGNHSIVELKVELPSNSPSS